MAHSVSYDEFPELFSLLARNMPQGTTRRSVRELVQDSREFIERYFSMLPPVDRWIAHYYYLDALSQDQVSVLFNITQAAVSRRLKFILTRLKFLLRQPVQNPIQVREDFKMLFPADLVEFAYFFYWEHAQNRVKYFIRTSQSGAANKFGRVLRFLEEVTALPEEGPYDAASLRVRDARGPNGKFLDPAKLGLLAADGQLLSEDEILTRRFLALTYLDYFRYTQVKSNVLTYLYKKNDNLRADALVSGPSII